MMPANMELTIPAGTTCSSGYSSAAASTQDNFLSFIEQKISRGPEAANCYRLSLEPPSHWNNTFFNGEFHQNSITHRTCTFYVAVDVPDIKPSQANLDHLTFNIVGPSGLQYPVQQLTRLPDGITCSFLPIEPGYYRLNVLLKKNHVTGSPSQKLILQNYQTILSMKIGGEVCTEERRPWSICCNTKTQQLLVADHDKHEILVYGPDGYFKFGTPGAADGQFCRPSGIAYDAVGDRILVTDKLNHRIQIFSSRGEFLSTFGSKGHGPGRFFYPWGIAVSRDGAFIAVADPRNHRIQLFNAKGKYLRQFQWDVMTDYPVGIAFSRNGDFLYVTDFNMETVFQVDIHRRTYTQLIKFGQLFQPSGLEVDDAGNLIVCSTNDNSIKVFTPFGDLLHTHHSIGTSILDKPMDIALMKDGLLAALDLNGRITII